MAKADLHLHTDFSDGLNRPAEVVRAACKAGLQVIAVTDHDILEGAFKARDYAVRNGLALEVVVGEEISTVNGHVIGLFLEKFVPPRLTAKRTVELIHKQGGLAFLPHPFHWYVGRDSKFPKAVELLGDIPFDGIETINHGDPLSYATNWRAEKLLRIHQLAAIGASDAHDSHFIGMACTEFPGNSGEDLRKAILNRTTQAQYLRHWKPKDIFRHLKGARAVLDRYSSIVSVL
jgi:predicted metal-dependent phosphoesterase TrpH